MLLQRDGHRCDVKISQVVPESKIASRTFRGDFDVFSKVFAAAGMK